MPESSSSSSSSDSKSSALGHERVQTALDEAMAENTEYRQGIYCKDIIIIIIIIKELEEELQVAKNKLAEYGWRRHRLVSRPRRPSRHEYGLLTSTVTFLSSAMSPAWVRSPMQGDSVDELPKSIRFKGQLPHGSRLGLIAQDMEDGTTPVKKFIYFAEKTNFQQVVQLCRGQCCVPTFKAGPWTLKKASQSLSDRLPGYHIDWASISSTGTGLKRPETSQRNPETRTPQRCRFHKPASPSLRAENQQYVWILTHINQASVRLAHSSLTGIDDQRIIGAPTATQGSLRFASWRRIRPGRRNRCQILSVHDAEPQAVHG